MRRFATLLAAIALCAAAPALADDSNSYDVDPDLQLTCVFGLVAYDYTEMVFTAYDDGTLEVDGVGTHSGILVDLAMTGTLYDDGSFDVSQAVLGGCNEYYSLVGAFDAEGDWTGTFSREFVPSYGGACFDCTDADLDVTGTCLDEQCTVGVEADSDGDGVLDGDDACPDTEDGLLIDEDGCSGEQGVDLAAGDVCDYRNDGLYQKAVAQAANDARDAGLLTGAERGAIVSARAALSCD